VSIASVLEDIFRIGVFVSEMPCRLDHSTGQERYRDRDAASFRTRAIGHKPGRVRERTLNRGREEELPAAVWIAKKCPDGIMCAMFPRGPQLIDFRRTAQPHPQGGGRVGEPGDVEAQRPPARLEVGEPLF
jgi:hypothetical protein